MNILKQIFCKHIWETTESKYLRTMGIVVLNWSVQRSEHRAETQKCVKCDKSRIIESIYGLPDRKLY
jgi:hypothetical protein